MGVALHAILIALVDVEMDAGLHVLVVVLAHVLDVLADVLEEQ